MNESLVKYLAGLLDADGSTSFAFKEDANRPGLYFCRLSLHLASSTAVDKLGFVSTLPGLTGMGSVCSQGRNQQFVDWYVTKRADLEMLLPRLTKHMVIKAQHWHWMLETWRAMRADGKTCSAEERQALTEASKESRRTRVGPLHAKNHPTWAWLAGYLDGDGCYSYRAYDVNGYRQWTIHVSAVAHANDASVLEFLERSFGGRIREKLGSGNVREWTRSLGYQNRSFALDFLPKLAKHSQLKRHKIEAIIHHHRQRLSVPGTEPTSCTADGCETQVHGHGLCSMHYQRERRLAQATV